MNRSLAMALMMIFFLIGCQQNKPDPIRLGLNPWPGYELFFLAQELGFYREANIPLQLVEFSSLGDSRRAYEQGLVDGIGTTLVEVAQIRELSDRQPKVILVSDFSDGADVILGREPVTSLSQLAGKRIGVEPATLGGYILHRALEKTGLSSAQVTIVPDNQLAMEQAFKNGRLDAMVTYAPFASRLLRDPAIHTLFTSREIPNEVVDVLVMDESVLQKNQKNVDKLLEVWDKTLVWYQQHPQDTVSFIARRERLSFLESQSSLDGIRLLSTREQLPFFSPGGYLQTLLSTIRRTMSHEAVPNGKIIHGDFILRRVAP